MPSTIDRRPEFTPPPEPGLLRSVTLAVAAHALLVLALSWGITWKRDDDNAAVEAELWSARAVEAAPKPVEAPPPPPPPPPVVQRPPAPPQPSEADIALERQREKEAQDKARREEAERQRKLEEEKREQAERQRKAELEKRELARKEAEAKKREELAKARERKEKEEAALEKMRKENLERIAGLAGSTGSPSSTGTALRSSGPSASYGGRLAALFRRNVLFPGGVETISGNPAAVVQVSVSPTGEILTAKLKRSSGNSAWDEAAVRAIERTQRIPPDENGRYVQTFDVDMRPKAQ
jgi:colicin import membrane protein